MSQRLRPLRGNNIRVLVVDDSALVRKMLTSKLEQERGIEVVGTAVDPFAARTKILSLKPDVVTLDIEMPRMDGLTFLGKLMAHHPIPVVILSSLAQRNSEAAARALVLGAVGVVAKPQSRTSVEGCIAELVAAIRAAAIARVTARKPVKVEKIASGGLRTTHQVVAIGASTGGPAAIERVLSSFPADSPGILICQHMPAGFTRSFAERLDEQVPFSVKEAADGAPVVPGAALIAPGGHHMELVRDGASYRTKLTAAAKEHSQRPAVDPLFRSVARHAGSNAVGVLLTGMGKDGATGLLAMKNAGAHTIAEAEGTCVVFGMPREAISMNAAVEIRPLSRVATSVFHALQKKAA
ncbi:MAG: chemotaxis response regulator protein-glutamate methylesterase [Myxococcota bacterium]